MMPTRRSGGGCFKRLANFLWYFVRLVDLIDPPLLARLSDADLRSREGAIPPFSTLAARSANWSRQYVHAVDEIDLSRALEHVWQKLVRAATEVELALEEAARDNTRKLDSRWPTESIYAPLFDDTEEEEEQLPRRLNVEFRQRGVPGKKVVILRCNGLNFGDRLTDNIEDQDGWLYHDAFHFANAVFTG